MTEAPFVLTPNQGPWREEWDFWREPSGLHSVLWWHCMVPWKQGMIVFSLTQAGGSLPKLGVRAWFGLPRDVTQRLLLRAGHSPAHPTTLAGIPAESPLLQTSLPFHVEKLSSQPPGKPSPLRVCAHARGHTHTHTHTHCPQPQGHWPSFPPQGVDLASCPQWKQKPGRVGVRAVSGNFHLNQWYTNTPEAKEHKGLLGIRERKTEENQTD